MSEADGLRALPVDEVVARVGVAQAIGIKHVASLLFTYRCSIACRHCLFSCRPKLPDVRVSFEHGLEFLRQLRSTDRVIHIAGGEAMLYYDEMLAICRAADGEGVAPHFFETNASWCKDDATTTERYLALREAGLKGVLISADPYHQAFVPPSRRHRAYEIAVDVYGRENVAAADLTLEELERLRRVGRDDEQLAEYNRGTQPRLVGRAGEELACFFPDRPFDELAGDTLWHGPAEDASCRREFDPSKMWEIHIDPYGNIQTCCGIILGNALDEPLPDRMRRGFHVDHELVRAVYERGPFALLDLAVQRGYEPLPTYKQKCHLCWEARKYLRRYYPETFGPAEIYDAPPVHYRGDPSGPA